MIKIIPLLLAFSLNVLANSFNTNQIINYASKGDLLLENEGYLFLSIDTKDRLLSLSIRSVKTQKKINFKKILIGENKALIKLKAGEYYWDIFYFNTDYGKYKYNFDKTEHVFTVKSGVISYPGTWYTKIKHISYEYAMLFLNHKNLLSQDYKYIRKNFVDLSNNYELEFIGEIRDNYINHYQTIKDTYKNKINVFQSTETLTDDYSLASKNSAHIYYEKSEGIKREIKSYKNINKYLKKGNQSVGSLNQSGNFLLYSKIHKEHSRLEILNLTTYKSYVITNEIQDKEYSIESIQWIDDNSIFYRVKRPKDTFNRVAHLDINSDGEITKVRHFTIPFDGDIIDPLINEGNYIYFSNKVLNFNYFLAHSVGLYKIDTTSKRSMKGSTRTVYLKMKEAEKSIYSLTDKEGNIRFTISSKYIEKEKKRIYTYWFLPKNNNDNWIKIKTYGSKEDIEIPALISENEKYFYVLTDNYSDKESIHKFSTIDFSYIEPFYEINDFDIKGIITDPNTQRITGVRYLDKGFYKYEYFNDEDDSLIELNKKYPSINFYSINENKKTSRNLLFGTNESSKGAWYLFNKKTKNILKLFDVAPDYEKLVKGRIHRLKLTTKDGFSIEGFLTMPSQNQSLSVPLIVIPHGGPIGVQDNLHNNEVQHFLASQGFASLKVNYRGSSGYGKKFKESGQLEWGEKIESDINEMVDYAISKYNISENKICSMGGSYGGYSAMMLTILYPKRYKCAVSLAGVSDIPLLFMNSAYTENKYLFDKMAEIAGNPKVNIEGLLIKSPMYLVDKITRPFLLFHGLEDSVVSIEHSMRMKEILDLAQKESELIILNNEGHSLSNIESNVIYAARSLDFIKKHLSKIE